jgi:formylglycine-generating enzyme required for sulfatase activity
MPLQVLPLQSAPTGGPGSRSRPPARVRWATVAVLALGVGAAIALVHCPQGEFVPNECRDNGGYTPGQYSTACVPAAGTRGSPLCAIPAGPFYRGCEPCLDQYCSDRLENNNELPAATVTLKAFEIDQFEATVEDWQACIADGACTLPQPAGPACALTATGLAAFATPRTAINCIDWSQAEAFCAWAGKRLPTEAEWEKAARGTDARTFPAGIEATQCDGANFGFCVYCDQVGTFENCERAGIRRPIEVDALPATVGPYGLYNAVGNVSEWTADWFDINYYAAAPTTDPTGPATGTFKVHRGWGFGGSFGGTLISTDELKRARVVSRPALAPDRTDPILGVRCARDVAPLD